MSSDDLEEIFKIMESAELINVEPAGPDKPGQWRVRVRFDLTVEQMKLLVGTIT